ncbi:MAG: hypothetical protein HY201_04195, partial [Nitrospirae bacterium]|nr:hypothetical protein [Candidatus Troglogloeales bacterium]
MGEFDKNSALLERSLRELKRLSTFLDHNPNPIVELDRNGAITYVNLAVFQKFLDFTTERNAHP